MAAPCHLDRAVKIAEEIMWELKPFCSRLLTAGSVRRRKTWVKDLEIMFIPRCGQVQPAGELFAVECNFAEQIIDSMLGSLFLAKRPGKDGSLSWGPQNKYGIHVQTGVSVDLFATTEESWWNYLVCRTGPKDSNKRIASEAKRRGWEWHPYGSGFSRLNPESGEEEHCVMHSEEEVFRFVNLPCLEPEFRQ